MVAVMIICILSCVSSPDAICQFVATSAMDKILQRHLIGALEALCMFKPKRFPVYLERFYDNDALDGGTILEWAWEYGRTEYTRDIVDAHTCFILRRAAEPLVDWLREAEIEDDLSDDSVLY